MKLLNLVDRGRLIAAFAAGALATTAVPQVDAAYTWRNVEIVGGGFVPGIVFNDSEPGLVYARTDIGGAYRRDPVSLRWISLTDGLGWDDWNLTGIVSLATDQLDPNRVYLAAGTYTNGWTSQNGAILRSTDRGTTWSRTFLPFKLGGNMPGRGTGERLAIDPNDNRILYLAAPSGNGLWKSTDYGVTWSKVTSFPTGGDYIADPADPYDYLNDIQGLYWVVFDEDTGTLGTATQAIYVGVASKTGPIIYRSTDAGSTWSAIPGQPVGYVPHRGVLDPVNNFLYITTSDDGGPYAGGKGEVWKFNTVSGAWTDISPVPLSAGDGLYFGYGGLSVDRQNPNIVMCTGYSSWWPDAKIWRSTNGGATWSEAYSWTNYPNRSFRYVQDITAAPWLDMGPAPQTGGRPGPDPHPKLGWMTEALAIDPFNSNHFMYGTGATIFGSDNLMLWDPNTTAQITIKVMAQGLEETAVFGHTCLISPSSGAPLISGLGDIAGFRHTDINVAPSKTIGYNPNWSTTSGLDFAELNPNFVVRVGNASSANSPAPSSAGKAGAYSTDNAQTWSPFMAQPAGTTNGGMAAVNANGTRIVWVPEGAAGAFVSTNNGGAWTAVTGLPLNGASGRPFVASDRVNSNKFYAFMEGKLYYSTNGGAAFIASAATPGFPLSGLRVKAVPGREGDVWLVGGSGADYGIWHSTDGGLTITKLANVAEADAIGFGKPADVGNYPVVYTSANIGGVRGVFKSEDIGASWLRINDDQHQYAFIGTALTGDPRVYGRVYIGTNGRGIIVGDSAPVSLPVPSAPTGLTAGAVSTSQINLTWLDNSNNETAFAIERATDAGFTAGFVSNSVGSNVANYQATGLAAGTTYFFRVKAVNAGGFSAATNTAGATTLTVPTTAPAAPSNLAASAASSSAVNLTWVDNASNESGFMIDRATNATFTTGLTTVAAGSNATSAQVGGLTNNTTYYFRVRATNAVGDSANSNTASATTKRR